MSFTQEYLIPLLRIIINERFFNSERGYQGQLVASLTRLIEENHLFPSETIIEQEYQKTRKHHRIRQRPDIIIHIPIEAGITNDRRANNYYVIALKLEGKFDDAVEDFGKLDEMFVQLDYPEGVFLNIGSYPNTYLENYKGNYKERIHEISLTLDGKDVKVKHCMFVNNEIDIQDD